MSKLDPHVFSSINQDSSDKSIKPVEARRILNLLPDKGGVSKDTRRVTVRGNTKVSFSFPSGTNEIFDKIEDNSSDNIYLFVWNSLGTHSIVRYNGATNTLTEVIQWLFTPDALDKDKPVEGGVIDGILLYTNGGEIKSVNVNRFETDENSIRYTLVNDPEMDFGISYLKPPPVFPPSVSKVNDSSVPTNRISNKNWQFACRYVYLDNEKSVLSPYSPVVYANIISDHFGNEAIPNRIKVDIDTGFSSSLPIKPIKSIEVYSREASTGDFRLFDTITDLTSNTYTTYFYNSEPGGFLSEAEASVVQENIPIKSNSIAVTKNRVFGIKSEYGFDDDGDYTITIDNKLTDVRTSPPAVLDAKRDFHFGFDINEELKWFKSNGLYNVGIIFSDSRGRVSSVHGSQRVHISGASALIYGNLDGTGNKGSQINLTQTRLGISITGTAPSWAEYYQIAVSRELFYKAYAQMVVNVMYYVKDHVEGDSLSSNEFISDGKIFLRDRQFSAGGSESGISKIYLQLPDNAPILPDSDSFVRMLNTSDLLISDAAKVKPEPALGTVGDFLVLDKKPFGLDLSSKLPDNLYIEVFKVSDSNDAILFEVGEKYKITGGALNHPEHILYGDTSLIGEYYESTKTAFRKIGNDTKLLYSRLEEDRVFFESPTPSYSGVQPLTVTERDDPEADNPGYRKLRPDSGYTLDYNLIALPGGRLNVVNTDEQKLVSENVIFYSDQIADAGKINGLSNVGILNEYPLPKDSGRIVKLVPAGENLIVLHERFTTTLYLGDQFLKSGNSDDILFKTDNVVGDDRKLKYTYGTLHPESVVENDGTVYFWDDSRGEPVRRDESGLTPLAKTADMQSWFKARKGLGGKVYGTFDSYLDLYIISFESSGETICYSERDRSWIAEISLTPEGFGKFRDRFVSFKAGEVWLHYENALHNNYYGVQYGYEIEFVSNLSANKDKIYRTISLDCSDEPDKVTISNTEGQETDVLTGEYDKKDSIYYASIRRDKNTPADALKSGQIPLRHGKEIRSQIVSLKVETSETPTQQIIDSIIVGYIDSPRANNLGD